MPRHLACESAGKPDALQTLARVISGLAERPPCLGVRSVLHRFRKQEYAAELTVVARAGERRAWLESGRGLPHSMTLPRWPQVHSVPTRS